MSRLATPPRTVCPAELACRRAGAAKNPSSLFSPALPLANPWPCSGGPKCGVGNKTSGRSEWLKPRHPRGNPELQDIPETMDISISVGSVLSSTVPKNMAFCPSHNGSRTVVETIRVRGRTMQCSGGTRRLDTPRRGCAFPPGGKQPNMRSKRRSNPPRDLRPERPHMSAPIPCR
jgi:hypothetical protein